LAKEAWVSVYVSAAGGRKQALLFKYGPALHDPIPSIVVSGEGNITISIPIVTDVHVQRHRWRKVSVDYDIGRVMHPDVNTPQE
jgi:hypothetical protein